MPTTSYLTIEGSHEAEIEVKRSRFRCRLAHVDTEATARAIVEQARNTHWDARHHCSAFILQPDARIARSSDDGEPSGTAGVPMLEVLRGESLTEVVAVVTRWFGGTLLGTGGLVRAYSDAVRQTLLQAPRRRFELCTEYEVQVAIANAGTVEQGLRRHFPILATTWADDVSIIVAVKPDEERHLYDVAAQLTAGTSHPRQHQQRWVAVAAVT